MNDLKVSKKICTLCKKERDIHLFHNNKNSKDGHHNYCKICNAVERYRKYKEPDVKEKQKERDCSPRSRWSRQRATRRKKGVPWEIEWEDYNEIIQNCCEYCGADISHESGSGLDRLNPERGYLKDNVVPCCSVCNFARGAHFTSEEMRILGKAIKEIQEERERKGIPRISSPTSYKQKKTKDRRSKKLSNFIKIALREGLIGEDEV